MAAAMMIPKLTSFSILRKQSLSTLHKSQFIVSRYASTFIRNLSSTNPSPQIAETTDDNTMPHEPPRNLFEVFASNNDLLAKEKPKVKFMTDQEIELAVKREGRRRGNRRVKIDPSKVSWTTGSKRVGAIGIKLGMSTLWKKSGRRLPTTLVQIKECQVIQARRSRTHGGLDPQTELQVGAVNDHELHKISKARYGHFRKHGIQPKKKVYSFQVTRNALLLPGTEIHAAHFYPGQYVKVSGITKDRGFQGVMKRWGMKGQPKTHGQTKTHRKMGATGGGQIHRINTKYNVLYIQGQLPGEKGGFLKITDAWKKHTQTPPFPTYFPDKDNPIEEDLMARYIQPFDGESIAYKEKKVKRGR